MFEHVGKNLDEEAAKRSAQSVFLTMLIFVGIGGGVFAYTAYKVTEAVSEEFFSDDEMVEVVMEDVAEEELSAPPPPPPPPPAPDQPDDEEEEEEEEEEEPDPEEMQEEVKELDEEVEEKVKTATKPKGVEGGQVGGDPINGQLGGVMGGDPNGVVGGTGTGAKAISKHEIRVKKPCDNRFNYPKAAADLNLGGVRCIAKVHVDEEGAPFKVEVKNCPNVFHRATKEGMMFCRWYPYRSGKTKIPVQFQVGVSYVPPR